MPADACAIVAVAVLRAIIRVYQADYDGLLDGGLDAALKLLPDARGRNPELRDVAKRVTARVSAALAPEAGRLDEGERYAVEMAVAESIDGAKVTTDLLGEVGYDPSALVRRVEEHRPENSHLSELAQTAYRHAVRITCGVILDTLAGAPTFALGVARHNAQQFAEMRRAISCLIENGHSQSKAIENYRRAVRTHLGSIRLLGIPEHQSSAEQELSVAYITLSVRVGPDRTSPSPRRDFAMDMDGSRDRAEEGNAARALRADEAFAADPAARRFLLVGEAGAGKTTLLQWLAVRAAARAHEPPLDGWNSLLPFYIRLRDFKDADKPFPGAPEFPGLLTQHPDFGDTSKWVAEFLGRGLGLVLIDGLDELPEARRGEAIQWLDGLMRDFPDSRLVASSRPHAVDEDPLERFGFAPLALQRMDARSVLQFIEFWHKAMGGKREADMAVIAEAENRVRRAVQDHAAVRDLATNPLMCAMLCALNHERKAPLPKRRRQLYGECCDVLLERRELGKGVSRADYPGADFQDLDLPGLRLLCSSLAYLMQANMDLQVHRERAEKDLGRCQSCPKGHEGSTLRLLVERCAVLRPVGADSLEFSHRALQDYLAAVALADKQEVNHLIEEGGNEFWRECIILSAGQLGQKDRGELISGLLKSRVRSVRLLAAECVETCDDSLTEDMRSSVVRALRRLAPPKGVPEVRAFAAVGEDAVDLLRRREEAPPESRAACVDALARIGGPKALDAVASYALDEHSHVEAALSVAWDGFDRRQYAETVFGQMVEAQRTLRLDEPSSLDGLQALPKLTGLSVMTSGIMDLAPVSALPDLRNLRVVCLSGVPSFQPLSACTSLRTLTLSLDREPAMALGDVLGHCPSVEHLVLMGRWDATGSVLGSGELRRLSIGGAAVEWPTAEDLTGCRVTWIDLILTTIPLHLLPAFPSLECLLIDGCKPDVADLEFLAGLRSLRRLQLAHMQRLSDLSDIAEMTGLQGLILVDCPLATDLSPLAAVPGLKLIELVDMPSDVRIPDALRDRVRRESSPDVGEPEGPLR